MSAPYLYPLNDFALVVTLKIVNDEGVMVPLETGTATAFFAVDADPLTTAANPALVTTPTYTGAGGKWLIKFEAADMDPTVLGTLFAAVTPFLNVHFSNASFFSIQCEYAPTRVETVT
jgi:hypothetical protein